MTADPEFDRSVLVKKMIHMQDKYIFLTKEAFHNSREFCKAMKEAFEAFVNRELKVSGERMLMADIFAQYTDIMLRGGRERQSDESHEVLFFTSICFDLFVF